MNLADPNVTIVGVSSLTNAPPTNNCPNTSDPQYTAFNGQTNGNGQYSNSTVCLPATFQIQRYASLYCNYQQYTEYFNQTDGVHNLTCGYPKPRSISIPAVDLYSITTQYVYGSDSNLPSAMNYGGSLTYYDHYGSNIGGTGITWDYNSPGNFWIYPSSMQGQNPGQYAGMIWGTDPDTNESVVLAAGEFTAQQGG